MAQPSIEEIEGLPYVDLLALLGESNRVPGGNDTMRRLIVSCHLGTHSHVLHAGCNTGFLSRNLARLSGCHVTGIDINPAMVATAAETARREGLATRVQHLHQDMRAMQFPDDTFDVTLSGGALAFVVDKSKAIEEWIRVTRPEGLLADAELYYRDSPSPALRRAVGAIIGVDVPHYGPGDWPALFQHPLLEDYDEHRAPVRVGTDQEVITYCQRMVAYCAAGWSSGARAALLSRLRDTFLTFNENLGHMDFIVLVKRRVSADGQPALYV